MDSNYLNLRINIDNENICFTVDKNQASLLHFSLDDNDSANNNIRVEFGIAKVFHKVLNLIKTERDLFQKEDFELLGEMLSKILFGKIRNQNDMKNQFDSEKQSEIDSRNFAMTVVETTLEISNPASNKICRIYLEFDKNSSLAMLPWEYIRYKTRSTKDSKSIYLSANIKSRFHLIRRVQENVTEIPKTDKLFIIVLVNVDGNKDAMPPIDNRSGELQKIKINFEKLLNNHPESLIIKYIESTSFSEIKQEVEETYRGWEDKYGLRPYYALHYLGHSMLEKQIGKLVFKNADSGKPDWVEDKLFASIFSEDNLEVNQPSLVCFQACDSAKIGSYDGKLRGVAYEFTSISIPAVVGMQNEIDTPYSNAFFERFYDGILNAMDVAEAVTAGRDFLGRKFNVIGDGYVNNSFGSPVLFITTEEPIRIIRSMDIEDIQEDASVKLLNFSGSLSSFSTREIVNERQKENDYLRVSRTGLQIDREQSQGSFSRQETIGHIGGSGAQGANDSKDESISPHSSNPTDI